MNHLSLLRDLLPAANRPDRLLELLGIPAGWERRFYSFQAVSGTCRAVRFLAIHEINRRDDGVLRHEANHVHSDLASRLRAVLPAGVTLIDQFSVLPHGMVRGSDVVQVEAALADWTADDVRPGAEITLYANQGWRPGVVLARRDTSQGVERLVVYGMPAGKQFYRIERQADGAGRSVTLKRLAKDWGAVASLTTALTAG